MHTIFQHLLQCSKIDLYYPNFILQQCTHLPRLRMKLTITRRLASGILSIKHFGNVTGWRMIFAIEGIITIGIGIILFFCLTDRPETARWLDQGEKDLATARIKAERLATTELIDKFDRTKIFRGIFSPITLLIACSFCLAGITIQGLSVFLPTIVKTIYPGMTTVQQQLRTAPPYVVAWFITVSVTYISSKVNRRQIFMICLPPLTMAGYAIFLGTTIHNPHIRYGAAFLIAAGCFPFIGFVNAQISANIVSDAARAAAIGTCVLGGNIGGLVSTWTFLPFDAPECKMLHPC